MLAAGFTSTVNGFPYVYAYSTAGGNDTATMTDSAGTDTFYGYPTNSVLTGPGFYDNVTGFKMVSASSTHGGNDVAYLYDSPGNDTFTASPTSATFSGTGFSNTAAGFRYVFAYSSAGGNDSADLTDAALDGLYIGQGNAGSLAGGTGATAYDLHATGFGFVQIDGTGSTDNRQRLSTTDPISYVLDELGTWVNG